ncbi:MAG TPA: hypothetical protein VLA33_08325 [Gemmatimonadota bacterium]|nr:hypothetical protein [Gemmatimonadota bacterium]
MIYCRTPFALAVGLAASVFLSGAATTALAQEMSHETTMADARPADPPTLPLDRNELVEVRTLEEERTVEFVIGPVALEAGMEHLRLPIQMAEFPVDGWMHGFEMEMVDGAGAPIPSELLHHVNFIDPDKRELFFPIARRVMAAGRETSTERLPGVIGYPIADGDRMLISAMFANALERDFDDAHLVVRFFYSTESDRLIQPRDIFPFYLDVMGPLGAKDFPLPPGRTVKAWEGKPAVDGRILGVGGHVHDYATRLALIDVTDGKTLWEVEPEGTPGGRITGVPSDRFLWSLGKKIHADHVYRIEVEYHNPLDEPAPDGGMGAIGGAVWVGKGVRWPEFDRTNEMYLGDLENTLTAPDRLHGHGGMSADEHASHDDPASADESDEGAMEHDGAHGH